MADLRAAIPAAFETREYVALEQIQREFEAKHESLFSEIEATGRGRGIAVLRSPAGVVFAPMRGGEVIAPDVFEKLPNDEKERFREAGAELQKDRPHGERRASDAASRRRRSGGAR